MSSPNLLSKAIHPGAPEHVETDATAPRSKAAHACAGLASILRLCRISHRNFATKCWNPHSQRARNGEIGGTKYLRPLRSQSLQLILQVLHLLLQLCSLICICSFISSHPFSLHKPHSNALGPSQPTHEPPSWMSSSLSDYKEAPAGWDASDAPHPALCAANFPASAMDWVTLPPELLRTWDESE